MVQLVVSKRPSRHEVAAILAVADSQPYNTLPSFWLGRFPMKYRPKLQTSSSVSCVGRHLKVVSSVSRFTSSQSLAMHTMTNTKLSGNSVDRSTLRSHRFTDIHPGIYRRSSYQPWQPELFGWMCRVCALVSNVRVRKIPVLLASWRRRTQSTGSCVGGGRRTLPQCRRARDTKAIGVGM